MQVIACFWKLESTLWVHRWHAKKAASFPCVHCLYKSLSLVIYQQGPVLAANVNPGSCRSQPACLIRVQGHVVLQILRLSSMP